MIDVTAPAATFLLRKWISMKRCSCATISITSVPILECLYLETRLRSVIDVARKPSICQPADEWNAMMLHENSIPLTIVFFTLSQKIEVHFDRRRNRHSYIGVGKQPVSTNDSIGRHGDVFVD